MSHEQLPDPSLPEHDPWEQVPQRTHRPWWFWLATGFGGLVLFLSACFVALYYIYAPSLSLTADRLGELNRTPSITLTAIGSGSPPGCPPGSLPKPNNCSNAKRGLSCGAMVWPAVG